MQALHDFFSMGGYAFYVWSAYGICFIVLVINVVIPLRREKKLINTLAERISKNKNEQAKT